MKSLFGNVKRVKASWRDSRGFTGNVTIIGCVSHYNRKHSYPKNTMRIKVLPREKAAIVNLRYKQGYPINMIAKALGRSTSFVHRVTEANKWYGHRKIDMRKLPALIRLGCSIKRWLNLQKYMAAWEAWICGEGEKPP